jgi:hypothetical protein
MQNIFKKKKHISDKRNSNETLILIALEAKKAFEVVDHIHLFWKIYHQDITGSTWLLIKELYRKTTTQVLKYQGVKQGRILSAGFYKAYNNDILNTLERSDMGFKIGTSYVGCPTCADDIMLCAKSEQEAQTLLYINL